MRHGWIATLAVLGLTAITHAAESGRPEAMAFPIKTEVTAAGTEYTTSTVGTDFVLSGTIAGDVAITATEPCRVTLSDVTMTGALTITGDVVLWLDGSSNSITSSSGAAVIVDGALTIGGPGTATLSGAPAKNVGVVDATSLTMAGGSLSVVLDSTTKNACGVAVQGGNYTQLAGTLSVTAESTNKQLGVALLKKNTAAVISGGILSITMAGEKGVGLSIDKSGCTATLSGGTLALNMSGAAAKGVKGDGSFTMTGGFLTASMTGDALLEAYEDSDEQNYIVTVSSTLASTTGVTAGTYLVQDASYAYAVKCGTVTISGGTVRVSASGVAGRGIGGDEGMTISGGLFDMEVSGDCTDQLIEMLDETTLTTALDRGTATCLRMGSATGTMAITGGTFYLTAEGTAGKGISCEGYLQIGTEGQTTTPSDATFSPDIQACTYGEKTYVAAAKQSVYTSLGTAVVDASATDYPGVTGYVTEASGDDVDYTNPKAIKADGALTQYGGRVRVYSKCDGGEGMESKTDMTIAGGLFEGTTYDDCLNASDSITITGGWLYCGSTGNDAIDSNGTLTITGGVILAFSATTPEVGIDVDDASYLAINGGVVVSFGSATDQAYTGSGSQSVWRSTSVTASTYTGKYLVLQGTSATYTVKVPACTASSLSLVCSIDGLSSPSVTSTAPTSGDTDFHGVYISE